VPPPLAVFPLAAVPGCRCPDGRRSRGGGKVASGGLRGYTGGSLFEKPYPARQRARQGGPRHQRSHSEQTDASGLIYMQARFYLPMYGRFASPDPARDQHFEATQSWNIYSYVQNNPIMAIDPNGEELVAIQLVNAKSVSVNSSTRGHVIVVDRSMVPRVAALVTGAEDSGTRLRITSSFRTNAEQGGLNSSNAVTPAAAGSSPHNAGLAIDGTDGKTKALPDSVVDQAEGLGMRWGGNFKKADDVHVDGVESSAQKTQLVTENQAQWQSGTVPGMTLNARTGAMAPANVSNAAMHRTTGQTAPATSTPSAAASTPSMWNRFVSWLKK
jgi:RHS repeat-associated protein